MPYKPGDVVQLKSGGPKMTVSDANYIEKGKVRCHWFAGAKLESGVFNELVIEPFAEGEGKKK